MTIYTSSLLHCYQLPIFLTKVPICWPSFLLWYQVSYIYLYGIQFFPYRHNFVEGIKKYMSNLYFHKSRRPGDGPVKRARAVWKLRAWKFNMAVAMNFFTTWSNFLKLFCRCSTKAEFLSWRLEQYEKTLLCINA